MITALWRWVRNGGVGLLPNIDKIRIPAEKFLQYALDFKKDKDKATAFQSALGYNKTNSDLLIANISANVLTAWLDDAEADEMRLISAYVDKR